MNRVSYLEVASQFLRIEKNAGYLLVAVDAGNGRVLGVDIVNRPDAPRWSRFLSGLAETSAPAPLGVIHHGNPALEQALATVFHDIPRQLCVRHFLASLYQYLRSFQSSPLSPHSVEARFYRSVSHLLKASTEDRAFQLYYSLIRSPEFKGPELESPMSWLKERFPLLVTHYRFPGMAPEAWVADRVAAEIAILLKAFPQGMSRRATLSIIRQHAAEIEKTLNVEITYRPGANADVPQFSMVVPF